MPYHNCIRLIKEIERIKEKTEEKMISYKKSKFCFLLYRKEIKNLELRVESCRELLKGLHSYLPELANGGKQYKGFRI